MGVAKSINRRKALAEALKSTAKGETITLDEMMILWGVSKGTFVNTRNLIPYFPEAAFVGAKNVINWPRKEALEALTKWEMRGDGEAKAKTQRLNKMMGLDSEEGEDSIISISEMSKASGLRADVEERMIRQGELVPISDNRRVAGRVFEIISRNLSRLGSVIDPNGREKPELRARLDQNGSNLLLAIHRELSLALGDEYVRQSISTTAGSGPRIAGKPRPPRGPKRSMVEPIGHAVTKRQRIDKPVGNRKPADKGHK